MHFDNVFRSIDSLHRISFGKSFHIFGKTRRPTSNRGLMMSIIFSFPSGT
jgi:hypothetical protein